MRHCDLCHCEEERFSATTKQSFLKRLLRRFAPRNDTRRFMLVLILWLMTAGSLYAQEKKSADAKDKSKTNQSKPAAQPSKSSTSGAANTAASKDSSAASPKDSTANSKSKPASAKSNNQCYGKMLHEFSHNTGPEQKREEWCKRGERSRKHRHRSARPDQGLLGIRRDATSDADQPEANHDAGHRVGQGLLHS